MHRPSFGVPLWIAFSLLLLAPPPASGAHWFVAPGGATGVPGAPGVPGDGTREKPFHDPWRALAVASAGDSIHIAQGIYHGRHDRSAWLVDRPRLTILGGYNATFTTRDPWKQPTVFAFDASYEGTNEANLMWGHDDHSGVVIDGLVFDGGGRNRYDPKPPLALRGGLSSVGPLVLFSSPDVVVRNCVLINSITGAAELRGEGSRFENNIVLNHHAVPMLSLRETRGGTRPIVVTGNTFALAHDDGDPPMGKGGEKGLAIRVAAATQIENNAFIACGNAAIHLLTKADRVAIDRNLFSLPLRAHVVTREGTREYLITDKNLEEMEDLGFKSSAGNRTADAGVTGLKAEWIEGVTRHLLRGYATPPREGIAALRKRYELGEPPAATGDDLGPIAPYVAVGDAASLRVEGADKVGGAGAKPVALKVELPAAAAPVAARTYTRIEWGQLFTATAEMEGRPVEVRLAIGNERNGFLLRESNAEKHLGFDVYHDGGGQYSEQGHLFAIRHSPAHRQWQETDKSSNAREAEDWYLIRGISRLTGVRQKATIQVESIVRTEPPARPAPPRPAGRHWFARAGATSGDGSREKPFRDPFQALEKATAGDAIHVAGGDYHGKLRSASWKIPARHLSLIGGYDAEFTTRDPWKNPTRLVMTPDADREDKSKHSGEFLESADISEGFVLDGFIFDGGSINTYFDAGGLNIRGTPIAALVQLRGPNLTIRNCLFVNANGTAVDLNGTHGTFENNIILNTSGSAVTLSAPGAGPWIIRHNTFIYALDPTARAGTGMSTAAGSLLLLRGRAAVKIQNNLFAFADNYAIRATVPRNKLMLDGNAFAANLHCHMSDADRLWLHDAVWDRRLADAGLPSAQGNVNVLPAHLPLDRDHLDKSLTRLFEVKGRYRRDDWVTIATTAGATVIPPPEPEVVEVVEPVKKEKPKEQTFEELLAELDRLKQASEKPAEVVAPTGPAYAPAYPWTKALDLARDPASTVGARRVPVKIEYSP